MTRNLFYPAVSLFAIITTACGPLVPLAYNNKKTDNPLTQTIGTAEATVWLQYLQKQYGYYIFDLEITNQSERQISFAPQWLSLYASPKKFVSPQEEDDVHALSAPNSALTMRRQFGASPGDIELVYHKKIKEKRAGAVLFALIGAGVILYDIAKDSEDSKKETWTKKDDLKSLGRDVLVDVALTASEVSVESANEAVFESQSMPFVLLRECTVQPGKTVRGKIFIPFETSYRYSRVVVPFGNTDYVFDLKRQGN
jgi:hypothetical protein